MFSLSNKGLGTGMVSVFIGLMIATIIGVSVTLPVISATITNLTTATPNATNASFPNIAPAAVTGATATIILLLPLFVAVILLVMYANMIQ